MILDRDETDYIAAKIVDYLEKYNHITDYYRYIKIEKMKDVPGSLPGVGIEDLLFQDYSINPENMDFSITEVESSISSHYDNLLEIVASFSVENTPGREIKFIVTETNTKKIVGFIKLASPLINAKPRNDFFGGKPLELKQFNNHTIMGFHIVPVQPFGFNYLGGKLLAGLCCSHKFRKIVDAKYGTNICMFETTSLYGNIKGTSMYDGMRPYLRYKGDTVSKFLLPFSEKVYTEMRNWMTERNDGVELIRRHSESGHKTASRKMKIQNKIIGIVKTNLKNYDTNKYNQFCKILKNSGEITTQKRFYISTYGYSNVREYLLGEDVALEKSDNYDKYEFDNVIKWWKKKAEKRYASLIEQGRLRTKLETWNNNPDDIDIIR